MTEAGNLTSRDIGSIHTNGEKYLKSLTKTSQIAL
jgi:hypothetical protein